MGAASRRVFHLGLLLAVVAVGCGRRLPSTAPVSGTITLQGKPLAGAAVSFVNESAPRFAIGRTDAEGRFTLTTFADGDGAVLGEHRVVVLDSPRADVDVTRRPDTLPTPEDYRRLEKAQQSTRVPEVYTSAGSTPLRAEVKREQNRFDFDLQVK